MAQTSPFAAIWASAALLLLALPRSLGGDDVPPSVASSSSCHADDGGAEGSPSPAAIVVVGSLNVDITIKVPRPPRLEETVMATDPGVTHAVGGKGANQAVAAARLAAVGDTSTTGRHQVRRVKFVCQFGGDAHASMLASELVKNDVDVSLSGRHPTLPSGQGIVLLSPGGEASSVVVGGANAAWPADAAELDRLMAEAVEGAAVLMLQREVPERVNAAAAAAAAAAGVPIVLDAGGVDTPVPPTLLAAVDYLCPNESELSRLTGGMPTDADEDVVAAAETLVAAGARRVLVTLGGRGAVLVSGGGGGGGGGGGREVTWLPPVGVPGGKVVDGTAAGDAFRAGLAVAIAEGEGGRGGRLARHGLRLAAAAGAAAASAAGAMPSLPTRAAAEALLPPEQRSRPKPTSSPPLAAAAADAAERLSRPPRCGAARSSGGSGGGDASREECPLRFGSRLNSMKSRPDLWTMSAAGDDDDKGGSGGSSWSSSWWPFGEKKTKSAAAGGAGTLSVPDMVRRLGSADGIDLVDFNYPQHLSGLTPETVTAALAAANLSAGAVAVRFPAAAHRRGGAFTHPSAAVRAAAVDVVAGACEWATALGAAGGVVVWPQFDGYDYHLQVNHTETWTRGVAALRAAVDRRECARRGVKISYEFKPTDASSRFAVVPGTGAALLLVRDVNRPGRFGLTLDAGHLMAAGENPAQSAAAAAAAGALFGFHLGDVHSRLGAEDGLAFGSVHAAGALELVYWLRSTGYDGHVYFDTFPEGEDPVREASYNVRAFRRMWRLAARLESEGMGDRLREHDAMGSLEMQEGLVS